VGVATPPKGHDKADRKFNPCRLFGFFMLTRKVGRFDLHLDLHNNKTFL